MIRSQSVGTLDKILSNVDLGKSVFKAKPRTKLYNSIKSVSNLGRAKSSIETDLNDIRQRLT